MNVEHPNLSNAKIISFDIETYDPNLSYGPGVYRDDGCILGVSIGDDAGFSEYYNIGHRGISEEERSGNLAYIRDVLGNNVPKVGANILYDMDWLENWSESLIKINGRLHDIQVAEPLLDEYQRKYSLDFQANKYLGIGKIKERPQEICDSMGWTGDFRQHLWKMKWEDVREYAKGDAWQPIKILDIQLKELEKQELMDLYRMEMRLFPMLLRMRKVGVRVDEEYREKAIEQLQKEVDKIREELWDEYGAFNWNSSRQLAEVFDSIGLAYNIKEETGNPTIDKDFLEYNPHPIAQKILRGRTGEKIINTVLKGAFTDHAVNGRVHCSFKPLKQDEGGTVSGRFSSSDPNLQAIPSRDEEYARLCRQCLIGEPDCDWGKIDYSQIEYRFIAHYARGERAEEIRERYRNDPKTDYHQLVMDWTGVDRFTAKRLNFGMAYFMGPDAMVRKFHFTRDEACALQDRYMENVPFMGPTRTAVVATGEARGYIHTILGRRARVTKAMRGGFSDDGEKMKKKTYVLFNRLIQGSAADLLKKAMVDSWESGLFDEGLLMPHITVHDELGVSVPRTRIAREAYRELKNCMEKAIELKIPVVADAEIGSSWGTTEEISDDIAWEKFLAEV